MAQQDFSKIKKFYLEGSFSIKELAEKFKVSQSALSGVARAECWHDLKQKNLAKRAEEVQNEIILKSKDELSSVLKRHRDLFFEAYLKIKAKLNSDRLSVDELLKLVTAICRLQQGERLAWGFFDNFKNEGETTMPEITIIEGLNRNRI